MGQIKNKTKLPKKCFHNIKPMVQLSVTDFHFVKTGLIKHVLPMGMLKNSPFTHEQNLKTVKNVTLSA